MSKPSEVSGNGRGPRGHYASGNAGGPGRPRRAVEADYLRTLTDACPPDTWREIVAHAVEDARAGDGKAREWLSRYLLGDKPGGLTELAASEQAGIDPVARRADALRPTKLDELLARVDRAGQGGA